MAGIDKTYTDSYQDYKEFKDWADTQTIRFFDGHKECIGDWVWEYEEEDFTNLNGRELPVMNTPTWLDAYLIQHCQSAFVIDRMRQVYGEESFNELRTVDLTAPPSAEFKQNRRIVIKPIKGRTKFPLNNKCFQKFRRNWMLQSNDSLWYNMDTKRWVRADQYYPHDTNTSDVSSVKALIRQLRKQYLPTGISFNLIGSCIGEEFEVLIK